MTLTHLESFEEYELIRICICLLGVSQHRFLIDRYRFCRQDGIQKYVRVHVGDDRNAS